MAEFSPRHLSVNNPSAHPDARAGGGGPGYFRVPRGPGPRGVQGTSQLRVNVNGSDVDRALEAAYRALPKLPTEVAERIASMLTPETFTMLLSGVVILYGTQFIPVVGQVVDVAMVGVGVGFLGWDAIEAAKRFGTFWNLSTQAKTDEDFERAADSFAQAIAIIGIDVFLALFGRKGRTAVKTDAVVARWARIIDGLNLKVAPDHGALWSRVGAARAAQIARAEGRTTLEMLLRNPDNALFERLYNAQFGKFHDAWPESKKRLTKEIWETLSRKYASGLQGEVEAYVNAPSLRQSKGKDVGWNAQIWSELDEISEVVQSNPKITTIRIYDLSGGTLDSVGHLTREQMLKTTSH